MPLGLAGLPNSSNPLFSLTEACQGLEDGAAGQGWSLLEIRWGNEKHSNQKYKSPYPEGWNQRELDWHILFLRLEADQAMVYLDEMYSH